MKGPLIHAMRRHVARQPHSYHTPGHKSGRLLPEALRPWQELFTYDLTELEGLDELSRAHGVLQESQALGAELYQARAFRYLVGGSSLGLKALILATLYGQKVFVPTNAHRSILHGLALAQARPIFLAPEQDAASGRPLDLSPDLLKEACAKHPSCKHLLFISPTYHGDCGHAAALIACAKERGLTVLCDAAHGAHFPFHSHLPADALQLGADACVYSAHKTLPVATQGSYLAIREEKLIDPVDRALRMLQTSSPSYLLLASLEAGLIMMATEGATLLSKGLAEIKSFRERLRPLRSLTLAEPSGLADPFKLYMLVRKGSPRQLERFLSQEHRIDMEMSDAAGVLALAPLDGLLTPLASALENYDALDLAPFSRAQGRPLALAKNGPMPMLEALTGPREDLPLKDAVGRLAAETLSIDPPGTAMVLPGSRIEEVHLHTFREHGFPEDLTVSVCLESSLEHDKLKG